MFKYIMFIDTQMHKQPFIFPKSFSHDVMAKAIGSNSESHMVPISTGFIGTDDNGNFVCYGRSETLNMEADPRDSIIATTHPWTWGFDSILCDHVFKELEKRRKAKCSKPSK